MKTVTQFHLHSARLYPLTDNIQIITKSLHRRAQHFYFFISPFGAAENKCPIEHQICMKSLNRKYMTIMFDTVKKSICTMLVIILHTSTYQKNLTE